MEVKTNVVVLGMKKGKGEFEGKPYDFTRVYVEEQFPKDSDVSRGTATVEYNAGKSEIFDTLKDHTFPMRAEILLEISTTGRGTSTVVKNIRPLDAKVGPPVHKAA